jgi:peptide deformylase
MLIQAQELLAICIQHELDHLDGVLFIDKARSLSPKRREIPADALQ